MAVIEGTRALKTWAGRYDFAVAGGAVSDIVLTSSDGPIPSGAFILSGYMEVTDAFTTSASGQAAIKVEGTGDIVAAAVVSGAPWSTTGRKSVVPVATGATSVKTTASRSPVISITVGAITAGSCNVVLNYR